MRIGESIVFEAAGATMGLAGLARLPSTYHPFVALSPALLGLALALAVLVLLPTRRLYLGGWPSSWLATYYLTVLLLALMVAELRGPTRFLVPILVLAYLAPFVTVREGLARLLRPRSGPGPGAGPNAARPPKNVTPPEP